MIAVLLVRFVLPRRRAAVTAIDAARSFSLLTRDAPLTVGGASSVASCISATDSHIVSLLSW